MSYLVDGLWSDAARSWNTWSGIWRSLEKVRPPFPRVSYTEAVARLQEKGSGIAWGEDIGGADETLLSEDYDLPVFVHDYPKGVKAFYMKENPDESRLVLCDDLIAPERIRGDHRR